MNLGEPLRAPSVRLRRAIRSITRPPLRVGRVVPLLSLSRKGKKSYFTKKMIKNLQSKKIYYSFAYYY